MKSHVTWLPSPSRASPWRHDAAKRVFDHVPSAFLAGEGTTRGALGGTKRRRTAERGASDGRNGGLAVAFHPVGGCPPSFLAGGHYRFIWAESCVIFQKLKTFFDIICFKTFYL
jgi:hypothetical protein